MKKRAFTVLTVVLALTVAVVPAAAAPSLVLVTNANDAGSGSFRAAIDQASANSSVTRIQFAGRFTIALQQTVWFTGTQDLTIGGAGSTLDGTNARGPAFRTTGGGDLSVFNLTVRNAPAEGISVEVPHFATGTVHVWLADVSIIDNDGHGVRVNDQDDPATAILDGDSDASVDVSVVGSPFHSQRLQRFGSRRAPRERGRQRGSQDHVQSFVGRE